MKQANELNISHIYKSIEGNPILSDVSLDFYGGEIHSLVGENASGKSTFVKLISGMLPVDAGKIIFNHKDLSDSSYKKVKQLKFETVFQDINLFDELSILENIYISDLGNPSAKGIFTKKNNMLKQFNRLMETFPIQLDPSMPVKQLDIAQKRFVELLKALTANPDVLILDEPAESFTSVDSELLYSCLNYQKKKGSIIIFVSHKLEQVLDISDKITVFCEGQISKTLLKENFSQNSILKLISGKEISNRYPKILVKKGAPVLTMQNVFTRTLNDFNMTLYQGEILGISGLIGCGKSAIGKAITGIDKLTSGRIKLHGITQNRLTPHKMINKGVTYIAEDSSNNLIPYFTAERNITLSNLKRASKGLYIRPKLETIAKKYYFSKLSISQNTDGLQTRHYSGGTMQKICISKALYSNSRILILDEPTKGMDAPSKSDVYNFMNDYVSNGNSIILLSSDFSEVAGMSDRVLIMSGGKIIKQLEKNIHLKEDIIYHSTLLV